MKTKNLIQQKSFDFAIQIIDVYKELKRAKEYDLAKQLLRSGTAIGAMIMESEHAESRADFIHKLSMALKEANECKYWINILHGPGYIDKKTHTPLSSQIRQILRLLVSIVKSSKRKLANIQFLISLRGLQDERSFATNTIIPERHLHSNLGPPVAPGGILPV